MSHSQEPPFAIQVELVEGCNLYCEFCGLRGIREERVKNHKFMSPVIVSEIVSEIKRLKWTSRIEFAMHGEPTLHPDIVEVIREFRSHLSNPLMITSNAGGLQNGHRALDLFDAGLDVLAIDAYETVKLASKFRESLNPAELLKRHILVYDYPADAAGNPHRRTKFKRICFLEDISKAAHGTHSVLNNHCGAGAPLNDSAAGRRCAKPFRELSIRWDGHVAICCNDWRGVYKIGNVHETPLDEIWNHPRFDAARRHLYLGERVFPPCKGCDAISPRVGLLPDKLGKQTMPAPDKKSDLFLKAALHGDPYTFPVQRPWEKKS